MSTSSILNTSNSSSLFASENLISNMNGISALKMMSNNGGNFGSSVLQSFTSERISVTLVPHTDAHSHNLHGEGAGRGDLSSGHPLDNVEFPKNQPIKISFRYPLTQNTILNWDTTLINNNLYIEVPNGCLPDASKEAFVSLLEYAEEVLRCHHAVVCFKKDRKDRTILVRTFMFLGFYLIPPGNELALTLSAEHEHVFMVYKID